MASRKRHREGGDDGSYTEEDNPQLGELAPYRKKKLFTVISNGIEVERTANYLTGPTLFFLLH
jgi:hypothetical protein